MKIITQDIHSLRQIQTEVIKHYAKTHFKDMNGEFWI
jgi:hypothetical protein